MSSDFGTPGEKLPVSEDELVDREVLSPNHNERTMPIQMVVIHYTEMQDKGFAIERLCDPEAQVSAHYLIGEQGEVVRLVPEEKRAWHAGVAYWRGHKDVNSA
ncbi:MAG TPA: N-acetylmuramoyl-L-alanine amidase, partial [Erythrobacter sp.]|nr:N-acetylmuramoyl-L-alanine amidase [Erythrobacter sp.]